MLASGVATATNVVEELGGVSASAARKGVEVTAPIAADGSVTFRFTAEAAGNYTLLVRYTGEGLALEARGPSGSAAITPGPPGPFATVHLPLAAASCAITASALGGRSAFVDWELLLDNAVGQGAAQASTAIGPAAGIPLPTPPGPTASPAPSSTVGPVSPSVSSAPIVSTSVGVLVGRPEPTRPIAAVGPGTSESVALAFAAQGVPEGVLVPAPEALSGSAALALEDPARPPIALDIFDRVALDERALAFSSWLDRVAWAPGSPSTAAPSAEGDLIASPGPAGVGAVATGPEADRTERAGFAPEMIAGAAVVAWIGRRWRSPSQKDGRRPACSMMRSDRGFGTG